MPLGQSLVQDLILSTSAARSSSRCLYPVHGAQALAKISLGSVTFKKPARPPRSPGAGYFGRISLVLRPSLGATIVPYRASTRYTTPRSVTSFARAVFCTCPPVCIPLASTFQRQLAAHVRIALCVVFFQPLALFSAIAHGIRSIIGLLLVSTCSCSSSLPVVFNVLGVALPA